MPTISANYRNIIQKYLLELPIQIGLLERHYKKTLNGQVFDRKMANLREYERRMKDGFQFLLHLTDKKVIATINLIRNHPKSLLIRNRVRYLKALKAYRRSKGIEITNSNLDKLILKLKGVSLFHSTKNPDEVCKTGLLPASELWLTQHKSCANPMDLVLGLDKPVFFTHGFHLGNFSDNYVLTNSRLIDLPNTLVSSLDLFTFVLIKTKKVAPCAIETQEWLVALEDYSINLFSGSDFWRLKAEYILTFFDSLKKYDRFASTHYYANFIDKAPKGEYPFLGEIKIYKKIAPSLLFRAKTQA